MTALIIIAIILSCILIVMSLAGMIASFKDDSLGTSLGKTITAIGILSQIFMHVFILVVLILLL
mgnify:CR=1 FL=1